MISAINAFIGAFVGGSLDSFVTHSVLIGVIATAEISLGVGIWLESPNNKAFREWFGVGLVLGGCIVSALFTVFLLVFDEGISRGQQAKIIALSPRVLTPDEITQIRNEISTYFIITPNTRTLRISVTSYAMDPESMLLGVEIEKALPLVHASSSLIGSTSPT